MIPGGFRTIIRALFGVEPKPQQNEMPEFRIVFNGEDYKVQSKWRNGSWSDCIPTQNSGYSHRWFDSRLGAECFMQQCLRHQRRHRVPFLPVDDSEQTK